MTTLERIRGRSRAVARGFMPMLVLAWAGAAASPCAGVAAATPQKAEIAGHTESSSHNGHGDHGHGDYTARDDSSRLTQPSGAHAGTGDAQSPAHGHPAPAPEPEHAAPAPGHHDCPHCSAGMGSGDGFERTHVACDTAATVADTFRGGSLGKPGADHAMPAAAAAFSARSFSRAGPRRAVAQALPAPGPSLNVRYCVFLI